MRPTYLILTFLLAVTVYGQTASEVLKAANAKFNSPKPLQFQTKYNLYKKHSDKNIYQSYNGFFMKNAANEVYMRIDKTDFLNTNKYNVKISHLEKAMLVSDKQPLSMGDFDIKKFQDLCKIGDFNTYKNFWQITLIPNKFSGLAYSKIVLTINKNYTMSKQEFYHNTSHNFSKDYTKTDLSNPKLEILYTNYSSKLTENQKLNTAYFFATGKNNSIVPTSAFKKYEITDNRTKTFKNK